MPAQTCYAALPFARHQDGNLTPSIQRVCANAEDACREAQSLGMTYAGAVAFSRVIDIEAGTATGAHLLNVVGEVPNVRYLGLKARKDFD